MPRRENTVIKNTTPTAMPIGRDAGARTFFCLSKNGHNSITTITMAGNTQVANGSNGPWICFNNS